MQGILCLLLLIIITNNGSANFHQTRREKSEHFPKNFPHDNLESQRNLREVSDFQNDTMEMSKKSVTQDEVKKLKRLIPNQNNVKFLEKRFVKKKHHHGHKKQAKMEHLKGRNRKERNFKKHSKKRKEQSEAKTKKLKKNTFTEKKLKNKNHHPQRISKSAKRKFKRLSPFNKVIDYLKSDQYAEISENNCGKNVNCQNSAYQLKGEKGIRNRKKRLSTNLRRKKSIYSERACEAECQKRSSNSEPCNCKNEKPIDFENQLKILNKGGENVETNKEKSGILNGIQNFFKDSPKPEVTSQCLNLTTTTDESFGSTKNNNFDTKNNSNSLNNNYLNNNIITPENIFATSSEAIPEVTREDIFQTTSETITEVGKPFSETTSEAIPEVTREDIFQTTDEAITEETSKPFEDTSEDEATREDIFMETTHENDILVISEETEATRRNPFKLSTENFIEATSESTIETTSEVIKEVTCEYFTDEILSGTSEILPDREKCFTEATSDPFPVTSNSPPCESTRKIETELENPDENYDCKNTEIFDKNEDENLFPQTETSTTEEDNYNTVSNNFYNPCFTTTPVPYDFNQLCNNNNNEESNDFSSNDKKYKKPIATFSIIFKTNKMGKPNKFRFKRKY